MTKISNICISLASEYKMAWGSKPHFKNRISSGYVAVLQNVVQSHINEPSSEINHQEVLFILSVQECDFKYHLS